MKATTVVESTTDNAIIYSKNRRQKSINGNKTAFLFKKVNLNFHLKINSILFSFSRSWKSSYFSTILSSNLRLILLAVYILHFFSSFVWDVDRFFPISFHLLQIYESSRKSNFFLNLSWNCGNTTILKSP